MTSQSPQNAPNFSAFSSAANEASQADQADVREAGTSEERKVLALEMIADQLALIHADLCAIDDFARGGGASIEAAPDSGEADRDDWNHEGGCFAEESALDPDITRSTEQHYAVGGYRYTDLQHAIAQAKRARRATASREQEFAG
ncbi:MAG TPA: hypothetical protein VI168_05050 [Croceibacterium sp.]